MDIRRLREQATRLITAGRWERAEVLYRQMLLMQPRDASLWLRHAELLKRLERTGASVGSYRMAAQLLRELGHPARAIACLKLALEQRRDDVDLVTDIIRIELHQRQQERAAHAFPRPASDAELEPPAAQLALPMLSSSDSRIVSLVPELNDPIPPPRLSAPRIPLEVESPLQRWPQVRRISDTELAIKPSPFSKWLVVTSASEIELRFFDDYEVDEEALWLEEP